MKKILFVAIVLQSIIAQAQISKLKPGLAGRIAPKEKEQFLKQKGKDEVWFYEHANYQGKKFVLGRGKFTLADLGITANDFFSSALVPAHLTVIVYFDDNLKGNWLMLSPDNANYGYNSDFTGINNYRYWQTPKGDALNGVANINDQISSIVICDPNQDFITIHADCDYKGQQLKLSAVPNYNHNTTSHYAMNEYFGRYAWPLLYFQFANKASSITFNGMVSGVDLYRNEMGGVEQYQNIACLNNVKLTLRNSNGNKVLGDFNDHVDEIGIQLKPGKVQQFN